MPKSLIVAILAVVVAGQACTTCVNSVIESDVSPFGSKRANVIARTCGGASGFAVQITPTTQAPVIDGIPAGEAVFWSFVKQGDRSDMEKYRAAVHAKWESETKLRVLYASYLQPQHIQTAIGSIQIAFEPVQQIAPK